MKKKTFKIYLITNGIFERRQLVNNIFYKYILYRIMKKNTFKIYLITNGIFECRQLVNKTFKIYLITNGFF